MRVLYAARLITLALLVNGAACTPRSPEIPRNEALARARAQARFEPASMEATRAIDNGRPVWRVTLKGPPLAPDHPLLYESLMVLIDRRTGEIVGMAKP